MLTIYRRHRRNCKHRAKGRKHRHCQCPIWVDGFLSGKEIRESLKVQDWRRAQDIIREWEAEDRRNSRPARKSLSECWQAFLADLEARKLHASTTGKYKLLRRQMEAHAENNGLGFIDEFQLSSVSSFRASWKDGPRSSAKKLERMRAFFRFAEQRDWIRKNPAAELKAPKVTLCPTLPFSSEEMRQILVATDEYKSRLVATSKRRAGWPGQWSEGASGSTQNC